MMNFCRNMFKTIHQLLILLYVLLHTTQCALDYYELDDSPEFNAYDRLSRQQRYEQILANLHDLFEEKSEDYKLIGRSSNNENEFNFVTQKREVDKQKVDDVLEEVTSTLDKIKTDLLRFNDEGILTVEVPISNTRRFKRDVSNDTAINASSEENITTEIITEKDEIVTENIATTEKVVTEKTVALRSNDTDTVSGRRMMPTIKTTSRVKNKLLSYLEDTFNEVERKIQPLTNIKIALSNDDNYRIGYIIATIDTLEVNLKKLKNDMILNQHNWDDEKILDLFDRIKASNNVASSLIDSLRKYLPNH